MLWQVNDFTVVVPEDIAVNTTVLTLRARAADANRSVTYALVGDSIASAAFAVDATTGNVTVALALNFELITSYALEFTLTDGVYPYRVDTARATVAISAVNDNAPVFYESPTARVVFTPEVAGPNATTAAYVVQVFEGTPAGTEIVQVGVLRVLRLRYNVGECLMMECVWFCVCDSTGMLSTYGHVS